MTLDNNGFLLDANEWDHNIAIQFASLENITMTDAHWQIIHFARDYYATHQQSPAIRLLVKSLKIRYGEEIGNSLYLQSLFPESPAVQIARIAGLPKPKRCI